jgi:hypothetical protein
MLNIFKKRKNKCYDFKYKVYYIDQTILEGEIKNSSLEPHEIFLLNKMVYSDNSCKYYNPEAIKQIEITDLIERVEE